MIFRCYVLDFKVGSQAQLNVCNLLWMNNKYALYVQSKAADGDSSKLGLIMVRHSKIIHSDAC